MHETTGTSTKISRGLVATAGAFALAALFATSSRADERPRHGTSSHPATHSAPASRPAPRSDHRSAPSNHFQAGTRSQAPSAGNWTSRPVARSGDWARRDVIARGTSPQWTGQGEAWRGRTGDTGRWHAPATAQPYRGFSTNGGRYQSDRRSWNRWSGNRGGFVWRGGRRSGAFQGRVTRIERFGGGYHVWFDDCFDPFWISDARFLLWPFRVGLFVSLSGAWNPAGYYDVYDAGPGGYAPYAAPYDGYGGGGSYAAPGATAILQGVVESVDFDNGVVVVRGDQDGRDATVELRGNDQRFGDLQPGDYVVLSGSWTRDGSFAALRVDQLQSR
jgi:hypothetical protein